MGGPASSGVESGAMDLAPPIPLNDLALRLGLALAFGAVIGLNRELLDKPAGMKTHSLVALGAAVLTVVGTTFTGTGGGLNGDAVSRVVQGVITGIGFLGAGVILRSESGRSVHGLTTAATVWLSACIGVACGAGLIRVALVAMVATLLVLILGGPLERAIYRRWHGGGKRGEEGGGSSSNA